MRPVADILHAAIHGACEHGGITVYEPERCLAKLEADARALWAVRVLDAWAEARDGRGQYQLQKLIGFGVTTYSVLCTGRDSLDLQHDAAATPDAARLAAAEAVFPTLDRNAPNWPGEKP